MNLTNFFIVYLYFGMHEQQIPLIIYNRDAASNPFISSLVQKPIQALQKHG